MKRMITVFFIKENSDEFGIENLLLPDAEGIIRVFTPENELIYFDIKTPGYFSFVTEKNSKELGLVSLEFHESTVYLVKEITSVSHPLKI